MAVTARCCIPERGAAFQSFAEVEAYLDGLGLFHMDLGLDRVRSGLELMEAKRLPCPVIQVVGTNGKGSTCAFLHSLVLAHGFRSGLFTSPHFVSPAERIRMNSKLLPESAWPGLVSRIHAVRPDLTYFELLTVMAATAFRDTESDVLIFEAGLGGRHDATSALDADMVCFTPIALDHTEVLGENIADIARDKADALRPGVWAAVSAPQEPEAALVLRKKAGAMRIPLAGMPGEEDSAKESEKSGIRPPDAALLDELTRGVRLGLSGPHQEINARTALTAWIILCRRQGWRMNPNAVRLGLERAFLPGRLQLLPGTGGRPPFLLDGAHNPHGMEALIRAFRERRWKPGAVVFSCLADKKPQKLIALLRRIAGDAPVLVPGIAGNPRAMKPGELAAMFGGGARAVESLPLALAEVTKEEMRGRIGTDPVLVCGSLYLLAEFYGLYPQALSHPE